MWLVMLCPYRSCCRKTCNARFRTDEHNTRITSIISSVHGHPNPDPEKIRREIISSKAKELALEMPTERPLAVIQETLAEHGITGVSKQDMVVMRRRIYRARWLEQREQRGSEQEPKNFWCPPVETKQDSDVNGAPVTDRNYFFITSERGKDQLVYEGFTFKFIRLRSGSSEQSWRCCHSGCKGAVDFNPSNGSLFPRQTLHNHPPPDPSKLNRRMLSATLKNTVVANSSVRIGVRNVKALATEEGVSLTKQDLVCINKCVYRARKLKSYEPMDFLAQESLSD